VLITGDTAPSLAYLDLAQDAELLVHEATFCEEERERAQETSHSTAREAAQVAAAAGVKLLALTHLSSRYFGPEVAREAREFFPETVVPRDFDVIEIPFPERGGPVLVKGGRRPAGFGIGIVGASMTRMVQIAVAGDISEAEEIQEILTPRASRPSSRARRTSR
jgi:hypothetical protein